MWVAHCPSQHNLIKILRSTTVWWLNLWHLQSCASSDNRAGWVWQKAITPKEAQAAWAAHIQPSGNTTESNAHGVDVDALSPSRVIKKIRLPLVLLYFWLLYWLDIIGCTFQTNSSYKWMAMKYAGNLSRASDSCFITLAFLARHCHQTQSLIPSPFSLYPS